MPPNSPPASKPAPLPPRVRNAIEAVQALLSRELSRSVDDALDAAHRDLFELSERSNAPLLQAHWLGNLQRLVNNRYRLFPRLLAELRAALESIREQPVAPERPATPQVVTRAEDMRLVEDTGPDEAAMLAELGRRQESRAGLPLLLLGQRFGVLAAAPAFTATALPVGAHGLASMFMRAVDELGLDEDARKVLLRAFDREAVSRYAPLAEAMNAVLDRAGVLPGLSFVPLRPRPANRPPGSRRVADGDRASAGTGGDAGATGSEPGGGVADETAGTTGGTPGIDAAPGTPRPAGLNEAQRLAQMRQWLAERRQLLKRLSGTGDAPRAPALGAMELDNVLAALQVGPGALRSTAELRQAVHEQARRLGSNSTLGEEDADSLALFARLYTGLQEHTDPRMHDVLAGLQLPLLRLAMRDLGFLVRASDPARRLLATVAEAGAGHHGADSLDPQLLQRLQEVVRSLSLQYPHDAEVFERANAALEEPLQASLRRAEIAERRHVEAARGRERLLSARRHAEAAIDWALAGHEPARFLRTLLEHAWTDALAMVALRHGTASATWHEHIATTAAIAEAIRGGTPAEPAHAERARQALGLVGYHPDPAAAIAGHLTGQADPDEDPASRTELVIGMKDRSRLGGGDALAPDPAERGAERAHAGERQWLARLQSVPAGQWIEFDSPNSPGGVVRLRLAWHGEDSERVLLLGVRGHPPSEPPVTTLRGLARLVAAGKARLLGETPDELLDQAWRGMIDQLVSPASADTAPAGNPGSM
ncbi:DUF1631 domain-containing protein [Lysobacter sp. GX 14042]|uniref:DUF1631 family protein n=1 Tax=Lysobacter sp. GX 14042 TaxID=2907155 RepID=UPI001F263B71|nr:DUF1631 family protein [Lysobacter sp. GX 14042]MCE7033485.1 DUF1631 domain-containing protein [Lysobacter sp. GX 14042]